ncbi:MAG: glycosyltransferase family 2 protein [Candidatus Gastranaerophilales bacterium]|nr:glycosyltransferase family 2 protein [Candidatus Gastranaerophilales bacterium]
MQIAFKHQMRKQRKNPPIINKNYKPFVTIMIPAHNEATVIDKTVENVLKMDYEHFEIIVIDDRSTDNTAEIVKSLSEKYDNVKSLIRRMDAFPGKSAVLNDALKIAEGEAILVFDADARTNSDFLKNLLPALEPQDVGAVQARKVIINRDYNFLTRCQDNEMSLDTHFQVGRDAVKGAVELRGNGELIKRTALNDIGGWNNYTITDDLDMSTRMHIKGWDVRFCPNVCVYEEGVLKYIPLVKQRRRWIEGSIRRYLEHFMSVLTSKDVSKRVALDMTAYISEFILPFWLMSEITFQVFRFVKGYGNQVMSSMTLAAIMCVFFICAFAYSLKKYNKLNIFETIKQSVETCVYLVVLWFPVVVFIVFKIIFGKKTMDWGKTAHGVLTPVAADKKEDVTV